MTDSFAISPFTMPAALAAADIFVGDDAAWLGDPDNHEQTIWLESFRRRASLAAGMPEIRRHATGSAADHAEWLRSQGWDAQVTQGSPQDVYLAAALDIAARWREVGRAYKDAASVDRVLLEAGVYTSPTRGAHPVVEVVTQHPSFSFCFQQADHRPTREALAAIAVDMATRRASEEVHLDFPAVDLTTRSSSRYMIGLHTGRNVVTQAAEQFRLELNEVGGRAGAAAEVAVTRGLGPRTIKIDGPFVVAVNRNGAPADGDKVVFAAYCARDSWKRPAEGRI